MRLTYVAILLPLIASARTEVSDSTGMSTLNLDEIVVTATRVPKLLKNTPVQTRLITAGDIARADATDIEDLLQQEMPGVEFSYAMNQQVHLNFGGFGGQSVLFLVDGERLAGETMDDVDFARIDMNNVARVEIVRGASSALYGSNAGGGVVNIITKEAARRFSANLNFRTARHNERRYMAAISNRLHSVQNTLSVTASRMDSYDVDNAPEPATRIVSTVYGHKTLNVKEQFTCKPTDGVKLSARAGFYMRELPRDADAPERYRAYSGGGRGEWKLTESDRVELSYSFDQYDKSQYRHLTGRDIRHYSNVRNSVRGFYNHDFDSGTLSAGADYMQDYLMNTRLKDSRCRQDNFDVFIQYDRAINDRWEIVGTARYDYFSDGHKSHFTPGVSARYALNRRLNLRAAYGMGFRVPTLKEKYYEFEMAGIWIVKGNPQLRPELSHNLNISADYTRGPYNITATAGYNYVRDRITTGLPYYRYVDDDNQLYLDYINLARFHSFGAELTAQAAWRCGVRARVSYAYTYEHSVRDRNGNEDNDPYMPARPHTLTARVDWHRTFARQYTLDLGLNVRYLSAVSNHEYKDYYNLAAGTTRVTYPAYAICKLSATQLLFNKVRLNLAIDNLFNYKPKYYYLNAPLTDGINLQAGISLEI